MPIYKKGQKDDLGNYRPASVTLMPEKLMEHIVLRACHPTALIGQPVSMGF